MRIVRFNAPTGQYYISALPVAENRAQYYACEVDGHALGSEEYKAEVDFALNDKFEIIDWLLNNTDFEDWESIAVKINDKVKVSEDYFWRQSSDFEMDDIDDPLDNFSASAEALDKFGMGINNIFPENCPICFNQLKIIENSASKAVGLFCVNDSCAGAAVKKLQKAIEILDIKGIGLSTCEKLYQAGIEKIEDVFDKTKFNRMKLIESNEFKSGRSLDIIVDAVDNKNSLELKRIINSMNFNDVGSTVSEVFARHMTGLKVDFGGLNKDACARLLDESSEDRIRLKKFMDMLRENHIDIVEPKELSSDVIKFEMTGSPSPLFKEKKGFVDAVSPHGYVHHKLNKDCNLLVTDDLTSTTGKMATAKKLGIETKTYAQVMQDLGIN